VNEIEKEFALNLLRALDVGIGGNILFDEEYLSIIPHEEKKAIKKTVRYLIEKGYKIC
jgi:hypothetical protein